MTVGKALCWNVNTTKGRKRRKEKQSTRILLADFLESLRTHVRVSIEYSSMTIQEVGIVG
jgi:hypothetical protein